MKPTGSIEMQMYKQPKKAAQEEVRLIASPFVRLVIFFFFWSTKAMWELWETTVTEQLKGTFTAGTRYLATCVLTNDTMKS